MKSVATKNKARENLRKDLYPISAGGPKAVTPVELVAVDTVSTIEKPFLKGEFSMFKKTLIAGVSVLSIALASAAFAGNGAATMSLKGGSTGDVPFPHQKHQETLKDCNACHKLFPQEAGAIEKGIAAGTLKKKDVMKQCQDCHKETKAKGADAKSGPTGCKDCHKK